MGDTASSRLDDAARSAGWHGARVTTTQTLTTRTAHDSTAPAGALVVFGITGDLARVMTLHSLYRLEARGLLDCPIIGIAADDWSIERLRKHAHECIEATGETIDEAVFDRFSARLSYHQGDFNDAATYEQVGQALSGMETPVFYLEIPPFLFGRVVAACPRRGCWTVPAWSSRSRSATTWHRPARSQPSCTSTWTSRSSTGSTTSSARWASRSC